MVPIHLKYTLPNSYNSSHLEVNSQKISTNPNCLRCQIDGRFRESKWVRTIHFFKESLWTFMESTVNRSLGRVHLYILYLYSKSNLGFFIIFKDEVVQKLVENSSGKTMIMPFFPGSLEVFQWVSIGGFSVYDGSFSVSTTSFWILVFRFQMTRYLNPKKLSCNRSNRGHSTTNPNKALL